MLGTALYVVLSLAPAAAPDGAQAEPAEPIERDYQGPQTVTPSAGAAVPAPTQPAKVDDGPAPLTVTDVPPPEPAAAPLPKKRPNPRMLTTMYGNPEEEQAYVGKGRIRFYPGLQVRNQIGWISPFTIDRLGTQYEEGGFSNGRIRWNPVFQVRNKFSLVGNFDFFNGRWAPTGSEDPVIDEIIRRGQPPGRPDLPVVDPEQLFVDDTGLAIFDFRELYVDYRFSFGLIRFGQQAFTWGQGILANGGNHNDRFGDLRFGSDSRGDLFERVLIATKPFAYRAGNIKHLAIAIGADLVYRDERVTLTEGDIAGQALLVVRYQPTTQDGNWIGGYAVYRNQQNASDGDVYPDDGDLEVGGVDLAGQGTLWLSDDFQLIGAFEAAMLFGRTSWLRDDEGTHKILQGGAAVRGYAGNHESWLVGFDGGYASGDPDPNDRWVNNFTFDAGHNVGLVMFDAVRGWRSAQSEILATNGDLAAEPLNGSQFLPTRGGVSNAIYFHPKLRYAMFEKLEFWGGPLMAAAPVPIVDPYASRLNGGVPTNSVGGDGGRRYYGTEVDIGIRGRFDIKNFWLQAGLQGGLLLPGPGLANAAANTDGPIGAVYFRTEIRY